MFALIHWCRSKTISVVPSSAILGSKEVNSESLIKYGASKCKGVIKLFRDDPKELDNYSVLNPDGVLVLKDKAILDRSNLSQEKKMFKKTNKSTKTKEASAQNILAENVIQRTSFHKIISTNSNANKIGSQSSCEDAALPLNAPITTKGSLCSTNKETATPLIDTPEDQRNRYSEEKKDKENENNREEEYENVQKNDDEFGGAEIVQSETTTDVENITSNDSTDNGNNAQGGNNNDAVNNNNNNQQQNIRIRPLQELQNLNQRVFNYPCRERANKEKLIARPGSRVFINSLEKTLLSQYFNKPNELVRRLLSHLVGDENLLDLCARGRRTKANIGRPGIPEDIINDMLSYVNSNCSPLSRAEFTKVVNSRCGTLRNPRR